MKLIFGSKKSGKFIVKLILLGMLIYIIALFAGQRMFILNKQKKIKNIKDKIAVQEVKINEVKSQLDAISLGDYDSLEEVAHKDLNLLKQGQRVFVNVKGN